MLLLFYLASLDKILVHDFKINIFLVEFSGNTGRNIFLTSIAHPAFYKSNISKIILFDDYSSKPITQDGYMWTEILHQSDLITAKDNHLDYRHYYISTSLGDGRRTRTSSKFRREAYTMGDLTLVTYIGDEREASTQHPKDQMAPQPPASLQASPFAQCYRMVILRHLKKGNIIGIFSWF